MKWITKGFISHYTHKSCQYINRDKMQKIEKHKKGKIEDLKQRNFELVQCQSATAISHELL